MGSCFSSANTSIITSLTAKVIWANGTLREFPVPITVSQVLETETPDTLFLCNSDRLYYEDYIQPLKPQEDLEVGQIYFLLPIGRLQYRLTASDMAALAVKASLALSSASSKKKKGGGSSRRRGNQVRISQVFDSSKNERYEFQQKITKQDVIELRRTGSVRKLKKSASRRAKMAVRSFKLSLSTIEEGVVLKE
ncbi:hypothetical protein GIB67_025447 [Kingdonia uniflora]|uniref:Uncharacterized protein n=1 Tax=Kingdonia uniflora TaxID=39325 RepID=A0A7J7N1M5_9MAGN|nr:hypothetical protein GIB67_025447 [Kingdonia uniflora]